MARILVIDDDPFVSESVSRTLRSAGHTVSVAHSGEDGLELARRNTFDVILSDLQMPGISGLEHIVQRAVAIAPGDEIDRADLPEEMLVRHPPARPAEGTVTAARERAEREMVVAALARNQGELARARARVEREPHDVVASHEETPHWREWGLTLQK